MEKRVLMSLFCLLAGLTAISQTYIPITNGMQILSNSNIKFIAGNYVFSDPDSNGVIQINGQHDIVLDGDSCTVNGQIYKGYMIKITNSHNITVKNFDSVFRYKYAMHIMNSDHITINGNTFCNNKVDSADWIDVWADYTRALGGGVMMYQCRAGNIHDNIMTRQNDGVALYHCDSIKLNDNDFSWNTSFGIRMFWSDTCHIFNNNCSHVNKPKRDPSDCAALLMIVSNKNTVTNNDLSWSGDGVFLGQYQHSTIPNNNYFAYNECSWSPHNAIEATFASGNVYKHNLCNYSDYGFWLGYSFQTVVDSNEVIGNYEDGIAIDRGYNNQITNNVFKDNPRAIALWEGSPIPDYTNQYSHDYDIHYNLFEANALSISLSKTEHSHLTGNTFNQSQTSSVYLEGQSNADTITGNFFIQPTIYHIVNSSTFNIYAPQNQYDPCDSLLIINKIWDHHVNSTAGTVQWWPVLPGPTPVNQIEPPCDLAEPPSVWYVYPQTGYRPDNRFGDSVYFDSTEKVVGAASVKLVTSRGYDMALNYRPAGDSVSCWTLHSTDTLYFWVRTIKNTHNFQYFSIRIGNPNGAYYKYAASPTLLNNANLVWKQYKCPVAGGNGFSRYVTGSMSLDSVNYVEIHADTWDYGFTLWVDGVQFAPCSPITALPGNINPDLLNFTAFPNPFSNATTIAYNLDHPSVVRLEVFTLEGIHICTLANGIRGGGYHEEIFSLGSVLSSSGMFIVRLTTSEVTRSLLISRVK